MIDVLRLSLSELVNVEVVHFRICLQYLETLPYMIAQKRAKLQIRPDTPRSGVRGRRCDTLYRHSLPQEKFLVIIT